ncbi:5'-nucleotidase, lipoprotein e(P4) family [Psychrilyobacter sp.]|uniref:5'-nucleotidase, lipoprotein e(P4) family n=1 Tax=Psychrilyobacter sp. TaxID=2586924 RepID=UPI0030199F26
MKKKILLIAALLALGTACTAIKTRVPEPTTKISMISNENHDIAKFANQSILGTVWVRDSGEYRALTHQAYNSGKFYLKEIVKDPQNKDKKLAIVLDLDETVLDNSAFAAWQAVNNKLFSPKDWARWVNAKQATEVPGSVDFVKTARDLGFEVFYVSNRNADLTVPTIKNLKNIGAPFADEEHVLGKTTTSNKASRLKSIEDKGYTIVLLGGDNLDDFDSAVHRKLNIDRRNHVEDMKDSYGTKFIVLPNPEYGGFDSGIVDGYYQLSTSEKIEIRKEVIKPWDGK